jgi:hypothetical protein
MLKLLFRKWWIVLIQGVLLMLISIFGFLFLLKVEDTFCTGHDPFF